MGAGIAGTAAALEIARRGKPVTLIEQFEFGHNRGSSHGPTRIFRLSYRDPLYVRFAIEAREDWRRLERDSGETLLDQCGGVDMGIGAAECALAMDTVGVEYEVLGPDDGDRLGIVISTDAVFQKDASVIVAMRSMMAQWELSMKAGSHALFGRPATLHADGETVSVQVAGMKWTPEAVIVAAGAWTRKLLAGTGIELPLVVTMEQVAYARCAREPEVVVIDWTHPAHYALPSRGRSNGVRAGLHQSGPIVDPDDGPFDPDPLNGEVTRQFVEQITGAEAELIGMESCLYTNAPNEDFLIARRGNLVLVSACSGHGFKFGPRVGRAAADLATGEDPRLPGRLAEAAL